MMDAQFRKIRELFAKRGVRFSVPDYQRGYEWERRQFEDLWTDLQRIESDRDVHYLGNIILLEKENELFEIVDGQQRLVTISILMMAIRDAHGYENDSDRRIEEILNTYPSDSKEPVRRLQLNDEEADGYFESLWNGDHENIAGNIENAYDFFSRKISGSDERELDELIEKIISSLQVVETKSSDTSLAYMVFQSQNERGKEVSPEILAKARIYGAAEQQDDEERRQKIIGYWEKIYGLLERELGHPRFRDGSKIRQPLSQILITSDNPTPARIEKSSFYREFDEVVQTQSDVLEFVEWFDEQVEKYIQLSSSGMDVSGRDLSEDEERHLQYLNAASSQSEVLSLSIINNVDDQQLREEFLRLASVLAMRMELAGTSSSDQHKIVYKAAQEVRESENIRDTLKTLIENETPADGEIIEYLKANELPIRGPWRFRTLLILASIEEERRGATRLNLNKLDIEHIAPRRSMTKPEYSEWRRTLDESTFDERKDLLGNLTLLFENDHSGVDETSFSHKKRSYKNSDIKITQGISRVETWDDEAILERTERLAKELTRRWSA